MSVLIDVKRKSPTCPQVFIMNLCTLILYSNKKYFYLQNRNVVNYAQANKFAELLALTGADGLLINENTEEYGGNKGDLKACASSIRKLSKVKCPCILKDIIIHPIQVLVQ
jgi:hypothetical protein